MTTWQLWRQDDNGNRFLISTHPQRDEAARQLADFESGHPHKQHYWISGTDNDCTDDNQTA